MVIIQSNAPPIVPSHVFFGEIFDNGVLPINEPTMYAIVSFTQREKIIPQGIIFKYLLSIKILSPSRILNNMATGSVIYKNPVMPVSRKRFGSIFFKSSTYSVQHPKCMMINKMIKLH